MENSNCDPGPRAGLAPQHPLQTSVDERLGQMRADELKVRQGIAPDD